MLLPVSKAGEMIRMNAVIAELLGRLAARGEKDVNERAERAFLDTAAAKGYITPEGVIDCKTNVALFICARP
jgi:hypothetical protein